MSRRKKVASWNSVDPETRQERRADAPDVARPHGGDQRYKDKKHWCRGKIGGRRHTGEVRLERKFWLRDDEPSCYRAEWHPARWSCSHQEVCSNPNCRKVLRWSLDRDCPDYTDEVTLFRRRLL